MSRKDARLAMEGAASACRALPKAGQELHESGGRVMRTFIGAMSLALCAGTSCLPLSLGALVLGLALLASP